MLNNLMWHNIYFLSISILFGTVPTVLEFLFLFCIVFEILYLYYLKIIIIFRIQIVECYFKQY